MAAPLRTVSQPLLKAVQSLPKENLASACERLNLPHKSLNLYVLRAKLEAFAKRDDEILALLQDVEDRQHGSPMAQHRPPQMAGSRWRRLKNPEMALKRLIAVLIFRFLTVIGLYYFKENVSWYVLSLLTNDKDTIFGSWILFIKPWLIPYLGLWVFASLLGQLSLYFTQAWVRGGVECKKVV